MNPNDPAYSMWRQNTTPMMDQGEASGRIGLRGTDPNALYTNALDMFRRVPNPQGETGDALTPGQEGGGIFDPIDTIIAVPRGVVGAAKGIYNLLDIVSFDVLPDWDHNPLGTSSSIVGGFVEVLSEFGVGFLTGSAAISAVSKAGKLGKVAKAAKWTKGKSFPQQLTHSMVAGGIADALVFEGDEMRLSNLIEAVPGLGNPLTEWLATKEGDADTLANRLKNVIEGGIAGSAAETVFRGIGASYRMARGIAAAADVVRSVRVAVSEGKPFDEVIKIREEALKRNRKWLEDIPEAAEEYFNRAERRAVEADPELSATLRRQEGVGSGRIQKRVLLDSVKSSKKFQALPKDTRQGIEDFIDRVGPTLFDGTTFKTQKTQAGGFYDFTEDLIVLASDVYKGEHGGRVFLHEAFHMLSRYLDDSMVARLQRQYAKETESFLAKNQVSQKELDSFKAKLTKAGKESNNDTANQMFNELVDYLDEFAKARGLAMEDIYRMTTFDEWFVDKMVKATDGSPASRATPRRDILTIRGIIDSMVDALFGRQRNASDVIAEKFLSGQMSNRYYRRVLENYSTSLEDRLARRGVDNPRGGGTPSRSIAASLAPGGGRSIKPGKGVIPRLTPEQVDRLNSGLTRNEDGTIDTSELLDYLADLRNTGNINLIPLVKGMGADEAAIVVESLIRGGGIPEPRVRPPLKDQVAGALDELEAARGRSAEEIAAGTAARGREATATLVDIEERLVEAIQEMHRRLESGSPDDQIQAVSEVIEALVVLRRDEASVRGHLLNQLNNGNLAELVAGSPRTRAALQELLDGVPGVVIQGGLTAAQRLGLRVLKTSATGVEIGVELFRNSILSGPRTATVNGIGNVFGMFGHQGERTLGAWLADRLLGKNRAEGIDIMATQEGRVLVGYVNQSLDAIGLLVGRKPRGMADSQGRPIAVSQAAESWRREGRGVTLDDQAWSEGVPKPRQIDAQKLGLGSYRAVEDTPVLDSMGRPIFDPSPLGHAVNLFGKFVNIPLRALGTADEWFQSSIARTNAEMLALRELGNAADSMSPQQINDHVARFMAQMFDDSGRLYSRRAVEDKAVKQALREGLDVKTPAGRSRVLELVENGDDRIGFEAFDHNRRHLSQQIEARVREATWKTELDTISKDPMRGLGTKTIVTLGQAAQNLVNKVPMAALIMPFIRTPTNLITWALNRNPTSLLWAGIRDNWYRSSPEKQAVLMGRLATGTALYTGAISLAAMGMITGRGPRDPEKRAMLRETGWQPYSVKVGDTYVSFARADPVSTIMGFIADLAETGAQVQNNDLETLTDIGGSVIGVLTSVITDKTFISGLTTFMSAVMRPDLYGNTLVKQYASAMVPNFFAQTLTPFTDELARARTALDAVAMRVPFLSTDYVDKVRNPLGEALLRDKGALGNVTDTVNPFTISTAKNDPLNAEFQTLGRSIGMPRRTIEGNIDLWGFRNDKGQTAYDRYQEITSETRIGSKTLRSSLMNLIKSRQYRSLPSQDEDGISSPRANMIRSEISRYRSRAFDQLLREFPALRQQYMEVQRIKARRQ
jgi:hypothetical protein